MKKSFELIFKMHGKNDLEKIQIITEGGLFRIGYLPSIEEAVELIKNLKNKINNYKYFISNYNNNQIELINNDIGDLLNTGRSRFDPPSLKKQKKERIKQVGYIYFLKDKDKKIKIGRTANLRKRVIAISMGLEKDLKLIHSIPSLDTTKDEHYFHNIFQSKSVEGEWFKLTCKDIRWIKSLSEVNII